LDVLGYTHRVACLVLTCCMIVLPSKHGHKTV
jgi:hypothetical protein